MKAPKLKEGPVWALGTMSGTSLDGVDAAMVLTDGQRIFEFGPNAFRPYTTAEQKGLRAALGCWPGDPGVADAAQIVETAHAELMSRFKGVEIAGFHGQTLAHDPGGRGTHQAGCGTSLARMLGLPVAWDFRSEDVRLGGQGAPLAPFFHFALAKRLGPGAPVAFLNLGGVGNLTWIDPLAPLPETEGALLAFDTGPANAPINDLLQARRGVICDTDGALARTGTADEAIVAEFLRHPYFRRSPPKSLDRNDFHSQIAAVGQLGDADAAATLTAIAAAAVAAGTRYFPRPVSQILVGGGGRRNGVLMAELGRRLPCPVIPVEAAGLDGDMLEAQAFAYLAVRVARGLTTSAPGTTGVNKPIGGGIVSSP
jgi:anhydro-N-acetylmuramic acid kinase